MKVFIIAHANTTSGGPELLHQFCNKLNENSIDAYMVYYESIHFPCNGPGEKVKETYKRYNCKYVNNIEDKSENVVVLSETQLFLLPKFKKARIIIWWLSVDNYYKSLNTKYTRFYAPFGMKGEKYNPFKNTYLHCCQSEYAIQFLISHKIDTNNIIKLSDYISSEFIDAVKDEKNVEKNNFVLYNPSKGIEFTNKIISKYDKCEWHALQGMTHSEMADLMKKSKLYIDFGNHPGKDRIPREAALCGCCIITNKRGAALNNIDIAIANEYKFDESEDNLTNIINKIDLLLREYQSKRNDFDSYRTRIINEENLFNCEVKELIKRIK